MSEIEERFLKLPDSEDYTRVRQFKIDAKGAVVSRGDSFRRKRHAGTANATNQTNNTSDINKSNLFLDFLIVGRLDFGVIFIKNDFNF